MTECHHRYKGYDETCLNCHKVIAGQGQVGHKRGYRYLRVFYCHGCQSCWSYGDNGNIVKAEHVLSVEDVTDEVEPLLKGVEDGM